MSSIWDGYKPGAPIATPPPASTGSIWNGYKPEIANVPQNPLEQHLVDSFQLIDPGRRQVVLSGLAKQAQAGDPAAARKIALLTPHVNAPAPATPDYADHSLSGEAFRASQGLQGVLGGVVDDVLGSSGQTAGDTETRDPNGNVTSVQGGRTNSLADQALDAEKARLLIAGGPAGGLVRTIAANAGIGAAYNAADSLNSGNTAGKSLPKVASNTLHAAITGAETGAVLGAGSKLAGAIVRGTAKFLDDPIGKAAFERVNATDPQGKIPEGQFQQAVKTEAAAIRSDPAQTQEINNTYRAGGIKAVTADTGVDARTATPVVPTDAQPVVPTAAPAEPSVTTSPTEAPATAGPTSGVPVERSVDPIQQIKREAVATSTGGPNLSSRAQQFDGTLQDTIKTLEDDSRYKASLAAAGGDKVVTNEAVLNAAREAGPLDEQSIVNAKPLDKIDTVTLVRAKATVDQAAKDFLDNWQNMSERGLSETDITAQAGHMAKLEAGYKVMSAEPGRATQIQSSFIDDAFKRAQKLKDLIENTKGATPELRNQRIAYDLAAFDRVMAKGKASGVFTKDTLSKLQNVISEYATAAKLTSPLTHAINISSNLLTLPQRAAENVVRAGWGALKGETSLGEAKYVFGSSQGLKNAATQFAKDMKQAVDPNAKDLAGDTSKSEIEPAIPGKVGKVIRTPFNFLTAADNFFKNVLRDSELHQSAFSKGYQEGFRGDALTKRVDELVKSPTPEMTTQSEKVAKEFTFQTDPGPIVKGITGILGKVPLLRLLIPFVRTPTDIIKFQAQRSLVGVFAPRNIKDIMAGGVERREAVARLGVGMGMSVGGLMAVFNMGDNITGAAPTNQGEKDNLYTSGKQPYSIKIGGKWYQYNRFQPVGMYLTQAVGLRDALTAIQDKTVRSGGTVDQAGTLFTSFVVTTAKGLADLPFVSGVSNVITALNDPTNTSTANKAFGGITTGLIPNVLRDVANAEDPVARSATTISDQVKAMLPGQKQTLPARQTVFGNNETATNSGLERGLIKITSNDQSNELTKALDQIGQQTGYYPQPPKAGTAVNGKKLTPTQFDSYTKAAGALFTTKLERALNDAAFTHLSAADKKSAVEKMVTSSRNTAANEVVGRQAHNPNHRIKAY